MPKKNVGREQTRADVEEMWKRLRDDFPEWSFSMSLTYAPNGWITIIVACEGPLVDGVQYRTSARVYNTPRSPSLMTDMWKALFGAHIQTERDIAGLPGLIGY